jgi:hypothetical protein
MSKSETQKSKILDTYKAIIKIQRAKELNIMKIKVTFTKEIEVSDELFKQYSGYTAAEDKEALILAILESTNADKIEAIRSTTGGRFIGLLGF